MIRDHFCDGRSQRKIGNSLLNRGMKKKKRGRKHSNRELIRSAERILIAKKIDWYIFKRVCIGKVTQLEYKINEWAGGVIEISGRKTRGDQEKRNCRREGRWRNLRKERQSVREGKGREIDEMKERGIDASIETEKRWRDVERRGKSMDGEGEKEKERGSVSLKEDRRESVNPSKRHLSQDSEPLEILSWYRREKGRTSERKRRTEGIVSIGMSSRVPDRIRRWRAVSWDYRPINIKRSRPDFVAWTRVESKKQQQTCYRNEEKRFR